MSPEAERTILEGVSILSSETHLASYRRGWWDGVTPLNIQYVIPTKIALIHSEISEALEGYRTDAMDTHLPHRSAIEVELADAMIRIADLAGFLDLDLAGAILEKMEYNANRADHNTEARAAAGGKKF